MSEHLQSSESNWRLSQLWFSRYSQLYFQRNIHWSLASVQQHLSTLVSWNYLHRTCSLVPADPGQDRSAWTLCWQCWPCIYPEPESRHWPCINLVYPAPGSRDLHSPSTTLATTCQVSEQVNELKSLSTKLDTNIQYYPARIHQFNRDGIQFTSTFPGGYLHILPSSLLPQLLQATTYYFESYFLWNGMHLLLLESRYAFWENLFGDKTLILLGFFSSTLDHSDLIKYFFILGMNDELCSSLITGHQMDYAILWFIICLDLRISLFPLYRVDTLFYTFIMALPYFQVCVGGVTPGTKRPSTIDTFRKWHRPSNIWVPIGKYRVGHVLSTLVRDVEYPEWISSSILCRVS